MNPRNWRLVLCAAALAIAAQAFAPWAPVRLAAFVAVCVGAAAVCMRAPARSGDLGREPWFLFGLAIAAIGAAEALQELTGGPTAAWAVPLRALSAMLMTLAVWFLIGDAPGRRWRTLIDPAIIAIGVAVVTWIFVLDPIAGRAGVATADRVVALAVPVLHLALLAAALRLVFATGLGTVPTRLLAAGIASLIIADTVNSVGLAQGNAASPTGARALWIAGVGLIGAAAAHPFVETVRESRADRESPITTARLAMLGGAALVGPIALIVRSSYDTGFNVPVVVGGMVVVLALILVRMAGLVRALGATALSHAQANGREKILRRAAHSLVAATERQSIYATAADAAIALVRDRPQTQVRLFIGGPERMRLVTGRGARSGGPQPILELASLPPRVVAQLRGADSALVTLDDDDLTPDAAAAVAATRGHPVSLLTPLVVDGAVAGVLAVAFDRAPGESRRRAIETVGSQAALAIETADLTEDLHARAGEARFRSLVQNASDVIAVIEPGGIIRFVTRSVGGMLGFEPSQLEGVSISRLLHPDDARRGPGVLADGNVIDWRLRRADGDYRHVEVIVADLRSDPNVEGIVLTMRDVTDRRELESRLAHQAFHDTLTGLANRALFEDRVGLALARRIRNPFGAVAVIYIDLDDFKGVNDTLGHQAGDELLRSASRRLVECLRPADTAARLGGDEFAVALELSDVDVETAIETVAQRILAALRRPFLLDGQEVYTRGSLGVASTLEGGTTVEELLRNADIAMYIAKQSGKGRFKRFEPGMHAPVLRQIELKGELQRAIERREFILNYQPIVSLPAGRLRGFEALVRWRHPVHGVIPPGEFIPLAEEAGLIGALGEWILTTACAQFQAWRSAHPEMSQLYVSVNLSGHQLHRGNLVADIDRVLADTGIDPQDLLLELTESVLVSDTERAIERLESLASRGVRIAIDDFGTGFSALAYLQRLPVDVLKLAAPFVQGLAAGQEPLTETILRLAGTLGLDVIAEGIEHPDQVETLVRLGCGFGQGYHFGRPLTAADAERLIVAVSGSAVPTVARSAALTAAPLS